MKCKCTDCQDEDCTDEKCRDEQKAVLDAKKMKYFREGQSLGDLFFEKESK